MTFNSTLADLASLEQLLATVVTKEWLDPSVIRNLWSVYGSKQEIPMEHRKGAMIILGMLSKDSRQIIEERIETLISVGLGALGKVDFVGTLSF